MGYHVVDPADVDPLPDRPSETRDIADETGLENLGLRRYVVAPGEDIPLTGLHYHDRQEEAFYVVTGALRIETPEREYAVGQDEFFVVGPGSPHRAFNPRERSSESVVVAVGAPRVRDGHAYEG